MVQQRARAALHDGFECFRCRRRHDRRRHLAHFRRRLVPVVAAAAAGAEAEESGAMAGGVAAQVWLAQGSPPPHIHMRRSCSAF